MFLAALIGVLAAIATCPTSAQPGGSNAYAEARAKFHTRLVRKGPAPQKYEAVSPPAGVEVVHYRSDDLDLIAWMNRPTGDAKRPAVLFLHGGFAFDEGDWAMSQPYRDAGFVVMMPLLRGENGQPGNYSMFFHELDDVAAAGHMLQSLPFVRSDHVFLAGHSVGGTLTLLTALGSSEFRAAASFSGAPDAKSWAASQPKVVPFDPNDAAEFRIRSPIEFATSFRCPVRIYHGTEEKLFAAPSAKLAGLAQAGGLDVQVVPVPGNHVSHVPAAIKESIIFFRKVAP